MRNRKQAGVCMATCVATSLVLVVGCVERRLTINSRPSGALVMLNDQEIGRTPVTTHFTWYGDYDVVLRLDGYETLKTHTKVNAPWYQWPPIDLFAELFWPGTIRDDHEREFEMEPEVEPTAEELLERADTLRAETLGLAPEHVPAEPETDELRTPQE